MLLWTCFTPFTHCLLWRHSHIAYIVAFISNTCPQRRTALKNSHRWSYTPPPSCHKPNCSALLISPSHSSGLSQWSGSPNYTISKRPLLLLPYHVRCICQCPADTSSIHCFNCLNFEPVTALLPAIALPPSFASDRHFPWHLLALAV